MTIRYRLSGSPRSGPTYKVALMLALAGEPFELRVIDLSRGEHKQPGYVARARFGQVPLLEDLSNGRHLVQSAAILDYLADRTGRFGGATYDERLSAREWMFWDFDRLAPAVYRTRRIVIGLTKATAEAEAEWREAAAQALALLDGHLTGRNFVVGEAATIADIDLYGVVAYCGEARIDLAPYPAIGAFMRRIEALPGFAPAAELLLPAA